MVPKKILVVEDEPHVQKLIQFILESDGYQVSAFDNGAKAFEELEREAPDLMLLDRNLPGMDGLSLCQKVREDNRFCRIPIIMLTVMADVKHFQQGLEAGADDYLAKPFSPEELLARIKAVFNRMGRG